MNPAKSLEPSPGHQTPPDEFWVVWLKSGQEFAMADATGNDVRRDLRAGIVEYSEVPDISGEPMLIRLSEVALMYRSTAASREVDLSMAQQRKSERGFDE